jgi:hypothetical protein
MISEPCSSKRAMVRKSKFAGTRCALSVSCLIRPGLSHTFDHVSFLRTRPTLLPFAPQNVQVSDTFVEIIGSVEEGLTVKMLGGVGLGEDIGISNVYAFLVFFH